MGARLAKLLQRLQQRQAFWKDQRLPDQRA